ncbi:MAG: hypothetical protein M0R77_16850 [Gammaproteobacteria bacterium]|nr:hypothetical protein [Gammaproteobacteria bacterium]
MAKRKRWIPFGWLPGHWGLEGKVRDQARIAYEYDGTDREIKLLELEEPTKERKKTILNLKASSGMIDDHEFQMAMIDIETSDDPTANQLAKLKLDYDQGKISIHQYELKKAEFEYGETSTEYKLAVLKQQVTLGEISNFEYEKKVATVLEQPWIKVVSSSYEPEDGIDGFSFELDYNHLFVQYLKQNGYTGLVDDEIVEEWFNDVSKTEMANEIEADYTIPKTTIVKEAAKTQDGKEVKKFS